MPSCVSAMRLAYNQYGSLSFVPTCDLQQVTGGRPAGQGLASGHWWASCHSSASERRLNSSSGRFVGRHTGMCFQLGRQVAGRFQSNSETNRRHDTCGNQQRAQNTSGSTSVHSSWYYYQYNALWAMNERAQERCRRVTCTCHVG